MTSCRSKFVVKLNDDKKDGDDIEYRQEKINDGKKRNMDCEKLHYYANCAKKKFVI